MQFKQPEVLFALFFLLIPLLVHLFQLRKFQKEDFTNVKFLKKISRQTRQSSRLKKWLVLLTRMLALAAIVFAFAQPFFPAEDETRIESEKIIYLDNSFSMQASGDSGELMNSAIQELLKNLPEEENLHLITNNEEFSNLSPEELRSELQEIEYTSSSLDFQGIQLKASQFENNSKQEIILISDFPQEIQIPTEIGENHQYHLIPKKSQNLVNLSLDSLYIEGQTPETINLKLQLSSNISQNGPVSVAVYNGEELLARKTINFELGNNNQEDFQLENTQISEGRIEIEDNGLQYDNTLFFSINESEKIPGIVISDENTDASFLSRIYSEEEFEFSTFTTDNIDFNALSQASYIILNELETINPSVENSIKKILDEGGALVIIPSAENNNLNTFLQSINAPVYNELNEQERLVTNISYEHPLLDAVFEQEVENFDYPTVQSFYTLNNAGNRVLSFQDNAAFLVARDNIFMFSAALNEENSNFKNSPLIVPVFYNMALSALSVPELYYEINAENQVTIPIESSGDEVLSLVSEEENFIPQQQAFSGKIQLNTNELPSKAGNFSVVYKDENIGNLSYNYNRNESSQEFQNIDAIDNVEVYDSVSEYFETSKAATQDRQLWKSFVIFALIFLTVEMLLLKYLK